MMLRALGVAVCVAFPAGSLAATECSFPPPETPRARIEVPAGTRIGLALGSGSMHGYAHLGVLLEIEARGLPVQVVAGTSVGALMGAMWASGMGARQVEALALAHDLDDLARPAVSWQGLFSSEAMRAPLAAAFGGRPIESWPRRFGAVATNVADGQRRLLTSGDAVEAIRASSAVPVLFIPILRGRERLVDGALVEPVPVAAARDLGANLVIAVDVAYRPSEEEAHGIAQYAFQAMHILVNALAAEQLRAADVAIRPNLHHRWMQCGREGLVAAGRDAVAHAWPEIARAVLARAAVPRQAESTLH
jgi:NTE family protein